MNPYTYWETAESGHKSFSRFALKLVNIPGSSAEIERFFSDWSRVHSAIRNRLSKETSKKLVHVYYSLKKAAIDREELNKPRRELEIAELSSEFENSLTMEDAVVDLVDDEQETEDPTYIGWSDEDIEDDVDFNDDDFERDLEEELRELLS